MAAFVKFQPFIENLGRKVFNLHTDTLKIMLTNVAPDPGYATKSQITEITAGFGYVAGGVQVPNNSYVQTAGVAKLSGDDAVINASGGVIGPYRWAVLYDDTATLDELIGYWDYGSEQSIPDGEQLILDSDQATGIFTLT